MQADLDVLLTEIANRACTLDDPDFMVDDYAGGNVDDAYQCGYEHGEIMLARELLKQFKERK